jgi:ATP-dependent Clp protease protease subunit
MLYDDGLAASIASVIAMAGDKIIMPKNAMLMVHNPWTIAIGNANDFRKMAEDLDKAREGIIVTYQNKSGMEKDEIIALMDAETWLTADEAVQKGFADEIEDEKQVAASVDGEFLVLNGQKMDFSRFKNTPKFAFLPPEKPQKEPENRQNSEDKQTEEGLLSLYQAQIQINKNQIGGIL